MPVSDIDHPTVPWNESGERLRLLIAFRNGELALDEKQSLSISYNEIWQAYCPSYSRKKLPGRLKTLRMAVLKERTPVGRKEPPNWKKSKAYKLLKESLRNGEISCNNNGQDWEEVYLSHPEYAKWNHEKFKQRLKALQDEIQNDMDRVAPDKEAFDRFAALHEVSHFSRKGYEQWQGSDAQALIWDDIIENKHITMRKRDLYGSRPEYYEHFPLNAFCAFLKQEIDTEKWRHTLKEKGKQFKAS